MKRKFLVVILAVCFAVLSAFALSACGESKAPEPSNGGNSDTPETTERVELKAEQIYSKVNPSVAFLLMTQPSALASGSGFFIDTKGTLVTNYHVIEDAFSGVIQTYDGNSATITKVIGYDETLDIAILQTTAKNTKPVTRSTEQSQIGETVYAIGYPEAFKLGISSSTFTTGMISMHRSLNGYTYIQSTVDITHGNSGGALINKYGEVIGITTAGLNYGDVDYMNLSIPVQRIDTVGRNVNETLEVTTRRHYPVYVTYMSDGSRFTRQTLKYEDKATAPSSPSKLYYVFAGWYKDNNFTSEFDFNTRILYDTTLYAKFDPKKYDVYYSLNGGSFSGTKPSDSWTINDCGKALPVPKRAGYLFDGWIDPSGNLLVNFPSSGNPENLSLTASWIQGAEGLVIDDGAVTSYNGTSTSVVIPKTFRGKNVTDIKQNAFYNCRSLTSVTIPNSVTSVGDSAFKNCSSLTSITIPDSVTSIGDSAFRYCSSLTNVTIPDSVTSIGNYAFGSCPIESATIPTLAIPNISNSRLKTVVLTSGKSIGVDTFYDCSSLTSVTIPDSVTSIGNRAFRYCSKLTSVTIPDSITSIGSYAFYNCRSLTSVTIPNSVTSIGDSAFSSCPIESATIPTLAIPNISNSRLKTVVLTSGKSIGNYAFYDCSSLTSVTIPDSVTSIGSSAFCDCSSLTSITIPDSVTSIGNSAFENCYRLTEVYNLSKLNIVKNTTNNGYIGYYALDIYTDVNTPSKLSEDNNGFVIHTADSGKKTLIGYFGSETCVTIPNSVTSIGSSAFDGCSSLTSITIPNSVTSIGYYAFDDCSSLTSVHISNLTAWLNIDFFNYSSNPLSYAHNLYLNNELVTELIIPDGITKIKNYAFRSCSSLTSITIPNSVTSIGSSAFNGCSSLTSITIPNSVTSIGDGAFYGCSSLTSITIPDSVTSIGDSAFDGCSSLTSVSIPNSVTSIGDYTFDGCSSLTSITIPNSVTSIGYCAFFNCSSLTSITIPNSVTSIGSRAFYGCSSLTSITIPDSVTSIGGYAFENCYRLAEVYNLSKLNIVKNTTNNGYIGYYALDIYTDINTPSKLSDDNNGFVIHTADSGEKL